MSTNKIFADLLKQTIALPSDQNPYIYFRDAIHDLTIYQMSDAWYRLMDMDVALLSISIAFYIATFILRHRNGRLWFFKTVETGSGPILVPHTNSIFSVLAIINALVNIPALSVMKAGYQEKIRVDVYTWLQPLQWPATIAVVISELHGISVFLYMMRTGGNKGAPRVFGKEIKPVAITASFAFLYIFTFVSISIPFAIAAAKYPTNFLAVDQFLDAVTIKADSWTEGQKFSFDANWISLAAAMTKLGNAGVISNRAAWLSLMANVILFTALFLPIGFLYIKTIFGRLRMLKNGNIQADSNQSRESKRLRSAYLLMILELTILLIASVAYSTVLAKWGIEYNEIIADQAAINLTWSILFAIFPIVSFCVSATLLWRAIQGSHDQGKAGSLVDPDSMRSSGRKISSRAQDQSFLSSMHVRVGPNYTEEYVEMDGRKEEKEETLYH